MKQASWSWSLRFNERIKEFDFIRNEEEPCVYKKTSGSAVAFLVLYVDDKMIAAKKMCDVQKLEELLNSECEKRIEVKKVGTADNPADMFTKAVPHSKFKHCLDLLNISSY